jgi:Holliday junction resolvase RusA-like endonuclease
MAEKTFFINKLPPSVNHAYITKAVKGRVFRFPTKDFKDFKQEMAISAKLRGVNTTDKPIKIMVEFTVADQRKHDIDNLLKCVFDSLTGIAYDDDNQIVEVFAKKKYVKGEQRTVVTLL